MTDQEVEILTFTDTPGNVVQDAIFFLATQGQWKESRIIAGEMVPTPQGGSVALAQVDVTMEERMDRELGTIVHQNDAI